MTKKKHEETEETLKKEAEKVADNKDINSQDQNPSVEVKEEEKIVTDQAGAGSQEEPPVKEARKEDDALVKLAEMQDKYIRLSAEFDNYRKRTLREKIELTKHAGENILISIVPVMDDFERALRSMESTADSGPVKAGIELIYSKFREFLNQNGIKEIDSLNSEFSVDLHEAVSKIPVTDEAQKGKVVDVLQKGYYLHDKVLRFAKVVVGE
jgi:molecular chaperone GrpE